MKTFRQVQCSDRLPEKDGMYLTHKGVSYWGGAWLKTAVYNDCSPEYWLEEIQLPTEESILFRVEKLEKTDFVTARFGNSWKKHAKENYDIDAVIDIAHIQGRRAILLERALSEVISKLK